MSETRKQARVVQTVTLVMERGYNPEILEATRLNKAEKYGTFIDSNLVWEM